MAAEAVSEGAGDSAAPPVRILSLDGGGIRGVLPLKMLVELERLTGRRVAEMFDVIVGTSTGGIAALSLAKPGPDGKPLHTARDVLDVYLKGGPLIFPRYRLSRERWDTRLGPARSHLYQRVASIVRPRRYGNSRYLPVGLSAVLHGVLGDSKLSEAVTEVMVPSYDMLHAEPVVFDSEAAADGSGPDPRMLDIAMATAAAPTYFPAQKMHADYERVLIDGGFVANNPSAIAYFAALRREHLAGRELDVLMVSIGTGHAPHDRLTYEEIWSRGWLTLAIGMLGVIFDATSDISDQLLRELIGWRQPHSRYWRFQTELPATNLALDDASPQNLLELSRAGDRMVRRHRDELAEIATLLTATRSRTEMRTKRQEAKA